MTWFFGLFGRKRHQSRKQGHFFAVDIVGESHYQKNLRKLCGRPTVDGEDKVMPAVVILEDTNPADPLAVRVDIRGRTVGYLSRHDARRHRAGKPKQRTSCQAHIRGGWDRGRYDKGSYGVWLDLEL